MNKSDVSKLPVHPVADIFPMLGDDELEELAADIAENGLREPLVVGIHEDKLVLIDGRNRRRACEIANVTPTTRELNGEDPAAFIISTNINRRHLTAGQRTMIVAKIYPEPAKLRRKGSGSLPGKGLNSGELAKARTVLAVLPEFAEQVIVGTKFLNAAYEEAIAIRKQSGDVKTILAELKRAAPDLHELVEAGKLPPPEALASLRERRRAAEEVKHNQRLSAFQALRDTLHGLRFFANSKIELAEFFSKDDRPDFERFFHHEDALEKLKPTATVGLAHVLVLIKHLEDDYGL